MTVVTYWISSETSPLGYCSSHQLRCQERICIFLLKIAHNIIASADTDHVTDHYIGYVREYVHRCLYIYVMYVLFIKPRQILKHTTLNQLQESPPHHAWLPPTQGQNSSWLEMQYNSTYSDVFYSESQLSGSTWLFG